MTKMEKSNSQEQDGQQPSKKELPVLTDYHWQRNEEGRQAIEQMSKYPLSLEELDKQIAEDARIIRGRKL